MWDIDNWRWDVWTIEDEMMYDIDNWRWYHWTLRSVEIIRDASWRFGDIDHWRWWWRSFEILINGSHIGDHLRWRALKILIFTDVYFILGELLNHAPLMPGRTEAHQIELIVRLLGAPNDAIWPGMSSLPFARSFSIPVQPYNNVSSKVGPQICQ